MATMSLVVLVGIPLLLVFVGGLAYIAVRGSKK